MATMSQLIANAKATASGDDGTVEIAMALAAITPQVSVVASPLTIEPQDLFLRTFRSVGFEDSDLAGFKTNLEHLLPAIAAKVATIPETAANSIGDVAELVRLWLLST